MEVAIGQSPDVMAIRVSKELKRIHEKAVEALVPFRRNSDGDPEWIIEHVYIRGANGSLSHLAKIPGIDFIRKELAEQDWIETLLSHEQPQSPEISQRSFVRVLTGPCARLCGTVTSLGESKVIVTIEMRTKKVRVHTILQNLQLIDCPPDQRHFFYQADLFS